MKYQRHQPYIDGLLYSKVDIEQGCDLKAKQSYIFLKLNNLYQLRYDQLCHLPSWPFYFSKSD